MGLSMNLHWNALNLPDNYVMTLHWNTLSPPKAILKVLGNLAGHGTNFVWNPNPEGGRKADIANNMCVAGSRAVIRLLTLYISSIEGCSGVSTIE